MSTQSCASSATGSSPQGSKGDSPSTSSQQQQQSGRKSSVGRAVDKAKAKLSRGGSEVLAGDEEEFEKMKAKEVKKEERQREYERLGLGEQTKMGMKGAGGFNSA